MASQKSRIRDGWNLMVTSVKKVFTYLMKKIRKMTTLKDLWTLDPIPALHQLQAQPRKRKSLAEKLIELFS